MLTSEIIPFNGKFKISFKIHRYYGGTIMVGLTTDNRKYSKQSSGW